MVLNTKQFTNIGKSNTYPFPVTLSGNVFPTASGTDRSILPVNGNGRPTDVNDAVYGWSSPSNWTSIKNNSANTVNYYRFKNEFVGNVYPTNTVDFDISTTNKKAYTSANGFTPPTGSTDDYQLICDNTEVAGSVYFPVPYISNTSNGTTPKPTIGISMSDNAVNINTSGTATLSQVQVSDILGRIIGNYNNINSNNFSVPSTQFQKGVFIIKVSDSEGKTYTSKFQR